MIFRRFNASNDGKYDRRNSTNCFERCHLVNKVMFFSLIILINYLTVKFNYLISYLITPQLHVRLCFYTRYAVSCLGVETVTFKE